MTYSKIYKTPGGMRFMSGRFVYDERVIKSCPVIGYMNDAGQIWNELHLADNVYMPDENVPENFKSGQTFKLTVLGKELDNCWNVEAVNIEKNVGTISLSTDIIPLKVDMITEITGENWLARSLRLTNTGEEYMPIDKVCPFAGTVWKHKPMGGENSYTFAEAKGGSDVPCFEAGLSIENIWGHEGDFRFVPIDETPLYYDGGMKGRSGWSRPAVVLRNNINGALFCAELAYSSNWQTTISGSFDPQNTSLTFEIGLNCPADHAVRVIAPGESVVTPAVHFTMSASGFEKLMQRRHKYVRESIMPKEDPIGKCLIEANHRGYLSDKENEPDILRDVDLAADAGVELYVIDAGWYGKEPNVWWDNVGNWDAAPWLPNDLYPIIDRVHERGMLFGLWMEMEAAGSNSGILEKHPEFFMTNGDEYVAEKRALDLSKPEVAKWVREQAEDVISRYKLDMFRLDHNHRTHEGGYALVGGYKENVHWRYIENLYGIMEYLRNKFPNVSFQNCAGGGGRMDFGILRYFHHSEMSDWMHVPRVNRIFAGTLTQLPPETIMQVMGTEVNEQVLKSDLTFQMQEIMGSRFIIRGIAPTVDERNPLLYGEMAKYINLYKEKLRAVLLSECLVYLHSNVTKGLMADEPWLAYEIAAPDGKSGYALAFRIGYGSADSITIKPRGIRRSIKYSVKYYREDDSFVMCGNALKEKGITIYAERPFSSELIYWEESE